jgi:uncharacterized membrane protein YfcA
VQSHGLTIVRLSAKVALFAVLGLLGTWFLWHWALVRTRAGAARGPAPSLYELAVGFVTDFLDTLGIGSFATTTSLYKLRRAVDDRLIPGTLNVGHTLPTLAQAFIYIAIVQVDMTTLLLMIAAAVAGAWLGAGTVARLPTRRVQIGLGVALIVAGALFVAQALAFFPRGGDTLALRGSALAVGVVCNFALGALMTLGIGLYGPCMILVSVLGMNPRAAFPIMMGSCAFLMPVAGRRFVRANAYSPSAALGLTLGGVPAVLAAAWIVRSLRMDEVRWLVVAVVAYAATSMLRSALSRGERGSEPGTGAIG